MEDLAGDGSGVPIIIRCLGHPWGDAKFGQISGARDLAEERCRRFGHPCDRRAAAAGRRGRHANTRA
ncbi:hypothetical protein [Streptomyces glaucus]|uniref:hypothetical protein n=1 Tax=Streptomyces glaucus TaxID=284029 RepID=UPI0031CFE1B9